MQLIEYNNNSDRYKEGSLKIIQHYDLPSLLEAIDKHLEENGYNQQESDKDENNEANKQADNQTKESHDDEAKMRERLIQRMKKQEAKTAVETQTAGHSKNVTEKPAKSKRKVPKTTTEENTKMTVKACEEDTSKRKKKDKRTKSRRVIKINVPDKTPASEVNVDKAKGCENAAEKKENKVTKVATIEDDIKSLESLIEGMSRLTIHDPVPIPEVAKLPQTSEPEVASKNRKRKLELQDVIGAQLKKLRTLVENEEKFYDSVLDGLGSYTIKEPEETSVQESSPSKKCKIEVVPVKEPDTRRLNEEPVKRKGIISLRHIRKSYVNNATSVSAPIRACAPVKDLRKVLQGRQGLCY